MLLNTLIEQVRNLDQRRDAAIIPADTKAAVDQAITAGKAMKLGGEHIGPERTSDEIERGAPPEIGRRSTWHRR